MRLAKQVDGGGIPVRGDVEGTRAYEWRAWRRKRSLRADAVCVDEYFVHEIAAQPQD